MIRDECGIISKASAVVNLQDNYIIRCIHQVIVIVIIIFELDNNYIDEDNPWKVILFYCLLYI